MRVDHPFRQALQEHSMSSDNGGSPSARPRPPLLIMWWLGIIFLAFFGILFSVVVGVQFFSPGPPGSAGDTESPVRKETLPFGIAVCSVVPLVSATLLLAEALRRNRAYRKTFAEWVEHEIVRAAHKDAMPVSAVDVAIRLSIKGSEARSVLDDMVSRGWAVPTKLETGLVVYRIQSL